MKKLCFILLLLSFLPVKSIASQSVTINGVSYRDLVTEQQLEMISMVSLCRAYHLHVGSLIDSNLLKGIQKILSDYQIKKKVYDAKTINYLGRFGRLADLNNDNYQGFINAGNRECELVLIYSKL
mgnify:CR=1 FL=1